MLTILGISCSTSRMPQSTNMQNKGRQYYTINAKKHSLSHQLTAQLHIENSKNKKMAITLLQHIA